MELMPACWRSLLTALSTSGNVGNALFHYQSLCQQQTTDVQGIPSLANFVEHLLRKRAVSLEDGTLKHQATLFYFEPPIQLNILTFLSLMAGSDGIPHKQLCQLSDTLVGSADQTDPWVQHILYVLLDQALFCNRKLAFQSDADAQYLLEKYAYVQSSLFQSETFQKAVSLLDLHKQQDGYSLALRVKQPALPKCEQNTEVVDLLNDRDNLQEEFLGPPISPEAQKEVVDTASDRPLETIANAGVQPFQVTENDTLPQDMESDKTPSSAMDRERAIEKLLPLGKQLLEEQHTSDNSVESALEVLREVDDMQAACEGLLLLKVDDVTFSKVCKGLLTDTLSFQRTTSFFNLVVLPRVKKLEHSASRILFALMVELAERYPQALVDCVLYPLLAEPNHGPPHFEITNRITKQCLAKKPDILLAFTERILREGLVHWSDYIISLLSTILCLKLSISDELVSLLVSQLEQNVASFASSPKFSSLIFHLVSKYPQMVRFHKTALAEILDNCAGFTAKSAKSKVEAL